MKVYIAKTFKLNDYVIVEGIRYKKNETPKNKYDNYVGSYFKGRVLTEQYAKALQENNKFPLMLELDYDVEKKCHTIKGC